MLQFFSWHISVRKGNAEPEDEMITVSMTTDYEFLDKKAQMMAEALDIRTLIKQNQKQKEHSKPVASGHQRVAGQRDALVRLPISFVPSKCSATSAHYIHHKQNNEDVYISQLDFFSLIAEAYSFRLPTLEEDLVRRPSRVGLSNNGAQVCYIYIFCSKNKRYFARRLPFSSIAHTQSL